MFLHGFEILGILFILGNWINPFFYYILMGFVFHLFLDYIYDRICHNHWEKVSVIHDYIKFRKYKKTLGALSFTAKLEERILSKSFTPLMMYS